LFDPIPLKVLRLCILHSTHQRNFNVHFVLQMCRIELLRGTANLACPCVIAVSAVQETVEKVQEEQQNCKTAESRCGGTQAVVRWECLYLFTVCLQGLSFK